MLRMSYSDHFFVHRPSVSQVVCLWTLSNDNSSKAIEAICL